MDKARFVEYFPIKDLHHKLNFPRGFTAKVPWWKALVEDIRQNGMATPILVNSRENYVDLGNHRVEAVKELGWTHVPAIVYGPEGDLVTCEDVQEYVADGEVVRRKNGGFTIKGTAPPQDCVYPQAKRRYFNKPKQEA